MRFLSLLSIAVSLYPVYGLSAPRATRPHGLTTDAQTFAGLTFDYIIVGGGTAGLTVANRLSENPSFNIGVIEAGELILDEDLINVPFFFGQSLGNPRWDWSFNTVEQPGLDNRPIFTPRGKILGGSSALNFMVEGRASKPEYDDWAALGNPGWDWNGLLPYFRKAESVTPGDPGIVPGADGVPGTDLTSHGRTGPLKVSYNRVINQVLDLAAPYVNSFVEFTGSAANSDPENGNSTGIWQTPRTVDETQGIRSYSANDYFVPVQSRSNLLVLSGAQATKILTRKTPATGVQATGVQYSVNGTSFSVKAQKEVILSAGSIQTPQLLELSGIGDADILSQFNITSVIDLPGVGENLQDHLLVSADFLLKDPAPHTWDQFRFNSTFKQEQQDLYADKKTGLLAATSSIFGFEPLQHLVSSDELSSIVNSLDSEIAGKTLTPIQQRTYELMKNQITSGAVAQVEFGMLPMGTVTSPLADGRSYITVAGLLSRPFSRGSVHINSANPLAAPTIDPNYFDLSFDAQVMTTSMQAARGILSSGPFADLLESPSTPGPDVQSADDFESFVRSAASTVFHPLGSASMAPKEIGGVVDTNLLVYGTSNLRIVDASVMPIIFAAHIQATIYAVAEKASDIIKGCA
ncbi:alcohol oxidase [Dendrothele bispora CBS 962.96]|uniref:Alcohol oxidase n=1 Tax=Dendrothele bispora (strain CBS 962.96) TaxID=1314807 RepID=A0A4S8MP21_DENBC|nr:alcohol oxidase [Dendrothele bispora CBS 962.96]